jgi:type VI secretion system FHA domain protein
MAMALTLRVSSYQSQVMGSNAIRVFHSSGTIGRTSDNDLVLPDPEKFVSGQHALISLESGGYFLTDRSTNGTSVNGREIPKGTRVRLNTGDLVRIGNYDVSVSIDDTPAAQASSGTPRAHHAADFFFDPSPVPGAQGSVDPLDFFSDPAHLPQRSQSPPHAASDHAPPDAAFFVPPAVTPGATPTSGPGAAVIPENWDATGFSAPAAEPARPASPAGPDLSPSASHDASASSTVRGLGAAANRATGTAGSQAGDVGRLLEAAGIDPATVDERTMAALGEILKVVVDGLMDVLRARAAIKNQFRVPMTTLKPLENNPLKFSASANDALFNLFGRRNSTFVEPVEAFREAFDDLKAHQMAMMAGMRAAFSALLDKFDPDRLQEGFDKGLKRVAILDVINRTKYWDLYREMHEEFGDDDATFRRLFGDDFAQAYEEQMQRLTALRRQQ